MSDELRQLLKHTDAGAPPPALDAAELPSRVRRSVSNQRRGRATFGFALLVGITVSVEYVDRHSQNAVSISHAIRNSRAPSPLPSPEGRGGRSTAIEIDLLIHERTAMLLEANAVLRKSAAQPDAFLQQLQMQRNRAALILLRSANREIPDDSVAATQLLKRTIDLFPETPAAQSAARLLNDLNLKRQS